MQSDRQGPTIDPNRPTVPTPWITTSAVLSLAALVGQVAFAAHVTYQSEAGSGDGWAALLLLYTIPFVAFLLTIWAALEWHRRRAATWLGIAIVPTAIAVSIGSAILGIVAGTQAAQHLA